MPNKPSLKAYSEVFNFVEVNCTFYEYPNSVTVKYWRQTVPEGFTFSVRCHQDLTHRIGLKPVDDAYYVLSRMVAYCDVLDAPFLVLETPSRYILNQEEVDRARDFFSSINLRGVRLVWEIRAPISPIVLDLMRDFNIVQCVDLSKEKASLKSDIIYSRLFGKGKHNRYQFTDKELEDIDLNARRYDHKVVALSYHGVRMNTDAARFMNYQKTGRFLPVTSFTGVDSVRVVLAEDTTFPTSKAKLIENQGWKVIDLTLDKRIHLSEVLVNIPERIYSSVDEVAVEVEKTV